MLESLVKADRKLFGLINGAHDPVLDFVMYWATDKWIWIPFYAWILYILIKHFNRRMILMIFIIAALVTMSDQVSVVIKNSVERLRPCHDPFFIGIIHTVNNICGGMYGFVSSHAANTMTFAVFVVGILPSHAKWVKVEILAYVVLVSYSRIYLGAHFPGDIIGGWFLGATIGFIGVLVWKRITINNKQPIAK